MPNVVFTISMDENFKVSVNGPLDQTLVCYGMLETAKVAVTQYAMEAAKRVQLASTDQIVGLAGAKRES